MYYTFFYSIKIKERNIHRNSFVYYQTQNYFYDRHRWPTLIAQTINYDNNGRVNNILV